MSEGDVRRKIGGRMTAKACHVVFLGECARRYCYVVQPMYVRKTGKTQCRQSLVNEGWALLRTTCDTPKRA
jgi:hypothetical protein